MSLINQQGLIAKISPPVDSSLATLLINEFISCERRFVQRDWEPAELDGGQFCEILGRILYHIDSQNLHLSKSLEDCLRYVENDNVTHQISPRHDALHLAKVIKVVYKFRSQRGAVHISPNYKPNHMDSKFIIENVRWLMNEVLRILGQGDREDIARIIQELLRFDVPCIGIFDNKVIVQRTDLKEDEEILLLLHFAGIEGYSRSHLLSIVHFSSQKLTSVLSKMTSHNARLIIAKQNGNYTLTDIGNKYIRENLSDKLIIA